MKSHKSDFIILFVLGAVTAVFFAAVLLKGWMRQDRPGLPVRTTYSNNIDATRIFYTLLGRIGLTVSRSKTRLQHDALTKTGTVFLLDPIIPVEHAEALALGKWIRHGGILVTTGLIPGLDPDIARLQKCEFETGNCPSSPADQKEPAENTDAITRTAGKRLALSSDVHTVSFGNRSGFNPDADCKGLADIRIKPLFTDSQGTRIVELSLGQGAIILLADAAFLSNGRIGRADNAILAVNLVSYAAATAKIPAISFDEYHFGFGVHKTGYGEIRKMLFTTPAGWSILCLVMAGLLFMVYKGRQFGPRRGLAGKKRRSILEFIYSAGATYRLAGAGRLVLEIIARRLKTRITASAGLHPQASNDEIASALAKNDPEKQKKFIDILKDCDACLSRNKLSDRQLNAILKKLSMLESEALYVHGKQ